LVRGRASVTRAGAFGRGGRGCSGAEQAREVHAEGPGAGPGRAVSVSVRAARLCVLVPAGPTVFVLAGSTGLSCWGTRGWTEFCCPALTVTGLSGKRKGVIASLRRHFDWF
jgi:hypothetical protein